MIRMHVSENCLQAEGYFFSSSSLCFSHVFSSISNGVLSSSIVLEFTCAVKPFLLYCFLLCFSLRACFGGPLSEFLYYFLVEDLYCFIKGLFQ